EGAITPELLAWYWRFARGTAGAIVVEATGIRDIPSGPLLRIGHDRYLPGLRKLVETVREASEGETRLFIQIIDFLQIRRRPTAEKFIRKYLGIGDHHRTALGAEGASDDEVRAKLLTLDDDGLRKVLSEREYEACMMGYRERVGDLHLPHIRDLPQTLPPLFAEAAARAREAGFDGVELHYAHAYTMASFLSALNQRDDGYGGDHAGRVRLPLDVYREVRRQVGDDYVVGCRYLSTDCIEGGMTTEDAARFGVEFALAVIVFLSLSLCGEFEGAKQH